MLSRAETIRKDIVRQVKSVFLPKRCAVELLDGGALRVQVMPVGTMCPAFTVDLARTSRNLNAVLEQYRDRLERQGYFAN